MKKHKVKKVKSVTFGQVIRKLLTIEPEFIYFDEVEEGIYTIPAVG